MIKRSPLAFFVLLILLTSGLVNSAEKKEIFYNDTVDTNLVSIGKNIIVNGNIKKSLIKIGGSLILNGTVKRDVVCISADVTIGENSLITGDLIVIGGILRGKNEDLVKGDIHNINFSFNKIDTSLTSFMITSKTVIIIKTLFLILSLIVSLIVFALFGKNVKRAEEILENNILRTGSLGILSVLFFILIFLITIVLSFIYIGIPILLILFIFVICLFIFGRTVIYYFIGRKIIEKFNLSIFSPAIFILIGVIVYFLLNYIPVIGFILLKVFAVFELGISIGYILQKKLNLKSISDFVADYGNETSE